MNTTWVLVTESSRARILVADSAISPLYEIESFVHPEARLHEQKLTSDLPGRQSNKHEVSSHSVADEVSPKEQEAINFAHTLTQHLEDAWNNNKFNQLIIIAAPDFLGLLRKSMPVSVTKQITFELDKNLCKHSIDEIQQHLPDRLPQI